MFEKSCDGERWIPMSSWKKVPSESKNEMSSVDPTIRGQARWMRKGHGWATERMRSSFPGWRRRNDGDESELNGPSSRCLLSVHEERNVVKYYEVES